MGRRDPGEHWARGPSGPVSDPDAVRYPSRASTRYHGLGTLWEGSRRRTEITRWVRRHQAAGPGPERPEEKQRETCLLPAEARGPRRVEPEQLTIEARGQVQCVTDASLSLTEAQAIADGSLREQDGPLGVSAHLIQDLAEADPAGVHRVQDVGGGDIGVNDPEGDGTERDLQSPWAPLR